MKLRDVVVFMTGRGLQAAVGRNMWAFVTFVVFVTSAVVSQSRSACVAFELDDQIKRYKDLARRTSDLRSYL